MRLTFSQPWATLVALGEKQFDLRADTTEYRGPVEIYAGSDDPMAEQAAMDHPVADLLTKHNLEFADLPRNQVVATVDLVAIHRSEQVIHSFNRKERKLNAKWFKAPYAWQFAQVTPVPVQTGDDPGVLAEPAATEKPRKKG